MNCQKGDIALVISEPNIGPDGGSFVGKLVEVVEPTSRRETRHFEGYTYHVRLDESHPHCWWCRTLSTEFKLVSLDDTVEHVNYAFIPDPCLRPLSGGELEETSTKRPKIVEVEET